MYYCLPFRKLFNYFYCFSIFFTTAQLEAAVDSCTKNNILLFEEAVYRAFASSPQLKMSAAEIQEKYGQKIQSKLYPNPYFSYIFQEGGDTVQPIEGASLSTFQITQFVELGNKRCIRMNTAKYDYAAAIANHEASTIYLLNQIRKYYIAVAASQEICKIAHEQVDVTKAMLQVTLDKVEAGKTDLLLYNKNKMFLARAVLASNQADANLKITKAKLSLIWGSRCPDFDEVVFPFYELCCPAAIEECFARLKNNPELIRSQNVYLAASQNYQLEKANSVPDVSVTFGYNQGQRNEDSGVIFGASMPIPLFNQNQGNIRTAQAQFERLYNEHLQNKIFLENKLAIAHGELVKAYRDTLFLKTTYLTTAQESYDMVCEGYKEGKFEYLEMLDSQRTLFDVKEMYIQALLTYHQRCTDIEYLHTQVD